LHIFKILKEIGKTKQEDFFERMGRERRTRQAGNPCYIARTGAKINTTA
jgi:hypothetical protein